MTDPAPTAPAGAVIRSLAVGPRRVAEAPVLVTGGAGFLGANLVDRLAAAGRTVLVYDSLAREGVDANLAWLLGRHGERVRPVIADIRDRERLREAVRGVGAVIHLAAQVAVTTSLDDPMTDFEVNARGTLELLEAVRLSPDRPPLLFASTNKVYGKLLRPEDCIRLPGRYEPGDPLWAAGVAETAPLDLQSPYGVSKGAADQYVLDYSRVFGLRTVVFRMSCLYGPRQFGTEDQGWVAHFLFAALAGRPITLFGDGRQVRDVLYVEDAVEAYLLALRDIDRLNGRAFNLGGGPACALSLLEMLELIGRVAGRQPEIRHADWRPGDQLWYVSDTRALAAATGWQARTSPEAGLAGLQGWATQHLASRPVAAPTRVAR